MKAVLKVAALVGALLPISPEFAAIAGEPLKGDVTTTEPRKTEYPRQNLPDSTIQGGVPAPIPPSTTVPLPNPCASKPELCV